MSFSREDRNKVLEFFVKLLLKFNEPVYYEHLRGYVSQAELVVRNYVYKQCKGEKLLRYFQRHKNYFDVDFRNEVVLNSRDTRIIDAIIKADISAAEKDAGVSDDLSSEKAITSDNSDYSRSNSISSNHESMSNVCDDVFADAKIKKKSDYEADTLKYFSEFLVLNEKINLETLEMKCLPEDIQHYVARFLNNDILLFFESNPEVFHIDEENFVSLESLQNHHDSTFENGQKLDLEDYFKHLYDFINCADFFFSILKKKSLLLNKLSGYLSRAPPEVSEYLKSNYVTFKDFLIEADNLFVLNDHGEVAVTKNGPQSLKNAKKLLDLKSNSTVSTKTLKRAVYNQLKSGIFAKQNSLSDKDQVNNQSDAKLGEIPMKNSAEDNLNLTKENELKAKRFNNSDDESVKIGNVECNKSANSHSGKNKKQKVEKLSIVKNLGNDENSTESNVVLENHFINEPLSNKSDHKQEHGIKVKNKEEDRPLELHVGEAFIDSEEDLFNKIKFNTEGYFLQCAFTVQLLCLEVVEKEIMLCFEYEYEAVKFFVETLEKLSGGMSDVTSLKGCLGNASKDVIFFMKNLYQGDKISLFFQKHNEFVMDSTIIKLSSSYIDHLENKRKSHQLYIDGAKVYDVYKLYNTRLLDIFIDVLGCLIEICRFLQNKSKIKLSRLSGIYSKLSSSQQNFINSLSGAQTHEKLQCFSEYFDIFKLPDNCIEFDHRLKLDIELFIHLITDFTLNLKTYRTSDESKLPYFDCLLNYIKNNENEYSLLTFNDIKDYLISSAEYILSNISYLKYHDLTSVIGNEILYNLLLQKKDSQFLIQLLEENNLFSVNDGKICIRKENEEAIQDSLSGENIKSSEEPPVIKKEEKMNEEIEQISNDDLENTSLSEIHLSSGKNDQQVDELCHEDLEIISQKKSSSFIDNDVYAAGTNKTFNENFTDEDSGVVLLEKNKFSDQQNYLSHEDKCMNVLISSAPPENDAKRNNDDNVTEECVISPATVNEETVVLNKQEAESVSESYSNVDETVDSENDSANEFDEEVLEICNLINNQKNTSTVDQINLSVSTEPCKPSFSNSACETDSRSNESFIQSNSSVKENNALEIKHIGYDVNDVNLNHVNNISSTENAHDKNHVESLSSSASVMNFQDNQNLSYCDHKPESDLKKYVQNSNLVENSVSDTSSSIKSPSTSESNQGNNEASQNEVSKTPNELHMPKKDSTENDSNESPMPVMNFQDNQNLSYCDHKPESDIKKYVRNSNLVENSVSDTSSSIKSPSTSESNQSNNKASQNEVSKTPNELHMPKKDSTENDSNESPMPNKDFSGSDSEGDSPQNNFDSNILQPLKAKIILMTFDSCIAETIINSEAKCIFCLKSCYHCDLHTYCSDCFNSLAVRDEILCYIPPKKDLNCGNMCFAFMFHKDLSAKSKSSDTGDRQIKHPDEVTQAKHSSNKSKGTKSHTDDIHHQSIQSNSKFNSSLIKNKKRYQMQSLTTSQNTHVLSDIPNSTQAQPSVTVHDTKTTKSCTEKCHRVDKECQVKNTSVSQITQTTNVITEVEIQTVLAGEVKACVPLCEKACLAKFPTLSQNTQTICETFDHDSQTNISGNIVPRYDTSSSKCQTMLTGQVREIANLIDKDCQTSLNQHIGKSTQTYADNTLEVASSQTKSDCESPPLSFVNIPCDVKSERSSPVAQKAFCDKACQTFATGPIIMKQIYHID